jgi:dTDP-4-amino-4,6-dideoxygalactose transaminase
MIPRRKIHIMKGELLLALRALFARPSNVDKCIAKWEEEFANYIGVHHAVAVNSGRKGMELILRALDLGSGDEIIIPAYTLKDLVGIIQEIGLVPVPADIDPKTFNIDPTSVVQRITKRTKAILATHLFGTPCQIEQLLDIAKTKTLYVIEDCAHSMGSEFKGKKTGSFGDASFFSFETIKPINTYGGGMVVTNNETLAHRLRGMIDRSGEETKVPLKKIFSACIENLFLPTPFSFPFFYMLATPFWSKKIYAFYRRFQRLSKSKTSYTNFQALIGKQKLMSLNERIFEKREKARVLSSFLDKKIAPQLISREGTPNYFFFVAHIPWDTTKVRRFLLTRGIDAGIGAEVADDCGNFLERNDCPNATEIFQHAIQLPFYEGMLLRDIKRVAEVLGQLCKESSLDGSTIYCGCN